MKTQSTKLETQNAGGAPPLRRRLTVFAGVVLFGLLLVLALRMTMAETLREGLSQVAVRVTGGHAPVGTGEVPEPGAGVTTGFAWVTFLLCGMAAIVGARAMGWGRVGKFLLMAAVVGIGVASVFAAANRFYAVVGLADLGMALAAGWAVSVLCDDRVLGHEGRRAVIGVLAAILVCWVAKGIYQRCIDIPDTIAWFEKNRTEALAAQGLSPDDPETKLFESRMMSKEVTGFITLSNVMAAGMVGLCAMMGGLVGGALRAELREGDATEISMRVLMASVKALVLGRRAWRAYEVSISMLFVFIAGVVLAGGVVVAILSGSRGGSVFSIVFGVVGFFGVLWWERVARWRRGIVVGIAAVIVIGGVAGIGYGLMKDTLPSRSLMFRWHYWTAGGAMIRDHAGLGVGLNNFGDYYTAYKRASSPEDVKDPHSFFVRMAAEMGVAAAVLIGVLAVWMMLGGTRRVNHEEHEGAKDHEDGGSVAGMVTAGVVFSVAWWGVRFWMADARDEYYVILDGLSVALSIGGIMMAGMLTREMSRELLRAVIVAGLFGALGMMVYDQINMALVTGPVAMLFWVLVGVADSYAEVQGSGFRGQKVAGVVCGVMSVGCAGVLAVLAWGPIVGENHAWDPVPFEERFARAASAGDLPAAEAALDEALSRGPRATDVLRQKIAIRMARHEPVAADVRRMLELDRANGRLWMLMGMLDTDVPREERVAILQNALKLDAQLEAGEVKKLTEQEKKDIGAKIETLNH